MICRRKEHFVQCISAITDIKKKKNTSYSFKIITYNPELTEKNGKKKEKSWSLYKQH